MVRIAIGTVNYNRKDDTLEFLKSLKRLNTKGIAIKVFVVDGGSTDGSADAISASFPKVMVLKKLENRGSAGGYNDAAHAAIAEKFDYILLINNDVLINDSLLLKNLLQTASSHPDIGVVSPKMYFAPGFEFYKEKYSPKDLGKVIWYAGGNFDWNNVLSSHRGIDTVDTGEFDVVEETGFTNTACILVKRAVFDKGTFFDESLFAYFDDNDFLEKVRRAGFRLYYDGRSSIFHKVSRTAGIGSPYADYMITRNRLIFGMRYAPFKTKLSLIKEALRLLVTGRQTQKKAILAFFQGRRGPAPKLP